MLNSSVQREKVVRSSQNMVALKTNFKDRTKNKEYASLQRGYTCLAKMSPFTITFLKGGCPKRAVASTSRV